jgi:hypothetical protein
MGGWEVRWDEGKYCRHVVHPKAKAMNQHGTLAELGVAQCS